MGDQARDGLGRFASEGGSAGAAARLAIAKHGTGLAEAYNANPAGEKAQIARYHEIKADLTAKLAPGIKRPSDAAVDKAVFKHKSASQSARIHASIDELANTTTNASNYGIRAKTGPAEHRASNIMLRDMSIAKAEKQEAELRSMVASYRPAAAAAKAKKLGPKNPFMPGSSEHAATSSRLKAAAKASKNRRAATGLGFKS